MPDSSALKQFKISEPADGYWRVTFDNPPHNLLNGETASELQALVQMMEDTADLRVIVFDSAHPDYFIARYDFASGGVDPTPGPTGLPTFLDATVRITQANAISIACIRGRTRGGGCELAQALDMRFASLERAIFGQPEVGIGIIPAGGALERLPLLVGYSRALEVIASAADYDAATAERYGWINRALPDSELDVYVDSLARRIAVFDGTVLATAKRLLQRHGTVPPEDLVESQTVAFQLVASPQVVQRFAKVREYAAGVGGGEFELNMGHHIAQVAAKQ